MMRREVSPPSSPSSSAPVLLPELLAPPARGVLCSSPVSSAVAGPALELVLGARVFALPLPFFSLHVPHRIGQPPLICSLKNSSEQSRKAYLLQ